MAREIVSASRVHSALWFAALLFVLPVAGCQRDSLTKFIGYDRAKMLRMTVSEEDERFAHDYVENIRQRRFGLVETDLNPGVDKSAAETNLERLAAIFPPREPVSAKLVLGNVIHHRDSATTSDLGFEYEFLPASQSTQSPPEWVLAEVVMETTGNKRTVERVTFTPGLESLEEINAFTLEGRGFSQYAVLLLATLAVVFSACAFVQCIRTKPLRRKWAWLILISIGVCSLTVNWTTGQCYFTPLAFHVIPGSAFCTAYGPWIIGASFPIGAAAFLIRRRSLIAKIASGSGSGVEASMQTSEHENPASCSSAGLSRFPFRPK
jgi:hypothetical protein